MKSLYAKTDNLFTNLIYFVIKAAKIYNNQKKIIVIH